MNDILPPKRPLNRPIPQAPRQGNVGMPPSPSGQNTVQTPQLAPIPQQPIQDIPPKKPKSRKVKKIILWILGGLLALLLLAAGAAYLWYTQSLQPVDAASKEKVQMEIVTGSSPSDIAELLEQKQLIKSKYAFDIYTRISGTRNKLQAGTYSLSPAESTQGIVEHLVSGKTEQVTITFLPGATLAQGREVLIKAGYSETEVDAALNKKYDHPLFQNKPEATDLEGYLWGDTYAFETGTSVEKILEETFDHYYQVVQTEKLVEAFRQENLNLYQGITLASIVQREVPHATDQKQVSQVFFSRLAVGMQLGSDVTYQYAAKKLGVPPNPSLDSPYNTRKYTGLPPGPIATPGKSALTSVAHPATGDYMFFLSGDDDVTYFARTSDEHEANIKNHCQKKCSIF